MKIRPVLLAVTTGAALVACSGGTNAANTGGTQTLSLASVDQGSIEDVVKAFEAANPGVKVNFTTSGADQFQQQIRTQLASGTAPDVMSVWPGNGNPGTVTVLAKGGYLKDLSGQPWVAKFPKVVSDVARYGGKTYDAIYGINGIGAVYNQEAMTKAGLTAPATWTELLAFCRAAKEKGTPAFALGIQDNWVTQVALYPLAATLVYGQDRDFEKKLAAGQTSFASSPWAAAFAKYGEMDQTGCFQANPLGTSYEASQKLAATGKTLGIIQGNWVISLLKKQNPAGTFTLKPVPATDDPSQTIIPAAAGAGYGVNAKAKNPELAMKFISFVMSPQGMNLFAEKQGGLPALPDTGFKLDASLTELSTYITQNKTVPFMDQLWPNPKVQQTMLTGIQEVFSKQSTPDKVLASMDADYKSGT